MKKYMPSLLMLAIFEAIAISLWLTKDNIFYLFNFSYIGASIALGTALISEKKDLCASCGAVPCGRLHARVFGDYLR